MSQGEGVEKTVGPASGLMLLPLGPNSDPLEEYIKGANTH